MYPRRQKNATTADWLMRSSLPEPNTGCWLWLRATTYNGYGQTTHAGRPQRAHRVAYEVFCDAIPDGAVIDHLCRQRLCINPDHLEPVTQRENNYRSPDYVGNRLLCPHGHERTPENTHVSRTGKKYCRPCMRRRGAERRTR